MKRVPPIKNGYVQLILLVLKSCLNTNILNEPNNRAAIIAENTGDINQEITIPLTPPI